MDCHYIAKRRFMGEEATLKAGMLVGQVRVMEGVLKGQDMRVMWQNESDL